MQIDSRDGSDLEKRQVDAGWALMAAACYFAASAISGLTAVGGLFLLGLLMPDMRVMVLSVVICGLLYVAYFSMCMRAQLLFNFFNGLSVILWIIGMLLVLKVFP